MRTFAIAVALACASSVGAQTPTGSAPADSLDRSWTPRPNRPGWAMLRLHGDHTRHETFAVRFRYPDRTKVPPHWHATTVHITVLRGTLLVGMGETVNESSMIRYGPGSFVMMEGGMVHYELFEGETDLHVEGVGPFSTIYVTPAATPATPQKK